MAVANKTIALRVDGSRPWMGLPATEWDGKSTAREMMAAAGMLGWNVRKRLIETDATPAGGEDYEILADLPKGLTRLAVSGERYTTVQAEELEEAANAITDGEATLDAVGHYSNGRRIFLTFQMGENIVLDPNGQHDEIGRFLNILGSHDGTTGIFFGTGNLRLACQNQLTAVKASALSVFKMRHTQNVADKMLVARQALSIGFKQSAVFEQEMQALIQSEMTDSQFWNLVKGIYPEPEKDVRGSVKKWTDKTDEVMSLWAAEDGTMAGLDKTAYRAYNALNEHLMWYGGVRDGNKENALVKASGFDTATNKRNLDLYKATLLATA